MFQKGDPIVITEGHTEAGKTGTFKWYSKLKIPGRECYVILNPSGRQRTEKPLYLDEKFITMAKAKTVTEEVTEAAGATSAMPARLKKEKPRQAFGKGETVIVTNPESPYHNIVGEIKSSVAKAGDYAVLFPEPTGSQRIHANDLELYQDPREYAEPAEVEAAPEFRNVLLDDISPDPNQPRRHFEQHDLDDLIDSVREEGVVQPIMVRPHPRGAGFMIVCGERRYQAAMAVRTAFKQRNAIPAVIRHLTDDEALNIQITENLQRKDVHPMEEALAIRKYLDHNHTLDEICAKLGKDKRYIAARLKLCDLIPEFQEAYLRGLMEHSDARLICATSADQQRALFRERARYAAPETEHPNPMQNQGIGNLLQHSDDDDEDEEDEDEDVYTDDEDYDFEDGEEESHPDDPLRVEGLKKFDFYNIKSWANKQHHKLDSARFETEDPELYPEMGPCGGCPHNSSNGLLLFMEEGGRVCSNGICFGIKTQRAFQSRLQELATDPAMLFVAGYHYTDEQKAKVKAAKDLGLIVLSEREWRRSWGNDKPEDLRKAFAVAGNQEGEIIDVFIYPTASASTKIAAEGGTPVKAQIAEISAREARAKELDNEKVYKEVSPLIQKHEAFLESNEPLSQAEQVALVLALLESAGFEIHRKFTKQFKYKNEAHFVEVLQQELLPGTINQLMRKVIAHKLINSTLDYGRHASPAAIMAIARQYLPSEVKEIELVYEEKAIKRQKRVDERIAALKGPAKPAKKEVTSD